MELLSRIYFLEHQLSVNLSPRPKVLPHFAQKVLTCSENYFLCTRSKRVLQFGKFLICRTDFFHTHFTKNAISLRSYVRSLLYFLLVVLPSFQKVFYNIAVILIKCAYMWSYETAYFQ